MGEREFVVVFIVLWGARWNMTRGWLTYFGDATQTWAFQLLEQRTHMSSALCDLWSDCACENVARGRCLCLHTPSIAKEFTFQQAKKHLWTKKTSVQSRMRFAKNSNFCSTSNRRAVPTELTRTNVLDSATSFPVTSKDRPPSCLGIDLMIIIFKSFQIVGVFVVSIVVHDEWVYFLLKSLSHVHHAVFSFLVLLQQKKKGRWFICPWAPSSFNLSTQLFSSRNLSSFFAILERSSNSSSSHWIIVHPNSDRDLRYLSSLCHLSKMVLHPSCLGWRVFCNISVALQYIPCRSEAPCSAPRVRFFRMTEPGTDRAT